MTNRTLTNAVLVAMLALVLPACGDGDDPPNSPSNNGPIAATITITATGLSSPTVTVAAGSRVTFQNSDTRGHAPASDPHPTHGSCPPLDQIGTIAAGQSRTSGNLNTPGTCRYHDHDSNADPRWSGTITVQ